jgi:hypothetical protein
MKKLTGIVLGASLVVAGAGALADGRYYSSESGYISDTDGRIYRYAVYGSGNGAAGPVTVDAADVNANGRAAAREVPMDADTDASAPVIVDSTDVNTDSRGAGVQARADTDYAPGRSASVPDQLAVVIGTPNVNDVRGRA